MSASLLATIFVANLKTSARYVDHFTVELYADSGLTTKLSTQNSGAEWDGSQYSVQTDLIKFPGLTQGTTYYLRAGVVSPMTGTIVWSATFSEVAGGTPQVPACTYSAVDFSSPSGVNFAVTPANVPVDLDHFEAAWTRDGSTPVSTAKAQWSGPLLVEGVFVFAASGQVGNQLTVFVRAVSTSSLIQAWQNVGTFIIPAAGNAYGKNMSANPGFELNKSNTPLNVGLAANRYCGDNWTVGAAWGDGLTPGYMTVALQSGGGANVHSGAQSVLVRINQNITLPGNSQWYGAGVYTDPLPCVTGQVVFFGGWANAARSAASPAGISIQQSIVIQFLDSTQTTVLGQNFLNSPSPSTNPWTYYSGNATAPAGTCFLRILCGGAVHNSTSSSISTGSNLWADMRFDDITLEFAVNPALGSFLCQGSVSASLNGTLTYAYSGGNTITWACNGVQILRADGSVTTLPSQNVPVSGLTQGVTYYVYPYWDDVNQIFGLVVNAAGTGTPQAMFSAAQTTSVPLCYQLTQAQNYQGFVPLSSAALACTIATSGGGGGGGGGSGTCVRTTMKVREKTRGVIPAGEVRKGDWIDGPEGWAEVEFAQPYKQHLWVRVTVDGHRLETTTTHPFRGMDEDCNEINPLYAHRLSLADQLFTKTGHAFVERIELLHEDGESMLIKLATQPHTFYAGEDEPFIEAHNQMIGT
jgi:hypothetical protein